MGYQKKPSFCPIEFDLSLSKEHEISFSVDGKPFGKQRPRIARRGKFSHAYTPKETIKYENQVRNKYKELYKDLRLEGPIEADLIGIFPLPKSISKKKRKDILESNQPHTKKPDCDNVAKCILDALNDTAYQDDSQICKLSVSKYYGEKAKIIINLKEINMR